MLHENLKALRKQKGLTQEELAIRLNVVRQTVSKWESGRSVPDADILLKIADVLDVSISDLLGAELPNESLSKTRSPPSSSGSTSSTPSATGGASASGGSCWVCWSVCWRLLLLVLLFSGSILTPPLPRPPVR